MKIHTQREPCLFIAIALAFIFINVGCSRSAQVNTMTNPTSPSATTGSSTESVASIYPNKDIKIEKFMSAILSEGTLFPGEGSTWNVDRKTFTKQVYGAELLDFESSLFQKHRNTTMLNGNSSVLPPLNIVFEDIDKKFTTYPIYVFNADEKLYCINYRYEYSVSQIDQYKFVVNKVFDLVTREDNELISKADSETPDISTFDFVKDDFIFIWYTAKHNQFLRMTSVEFQGHLFLDITICNQSSFY